MGHYDLVICGAGPSGSTTARAAAKSGLKVLLIEKDVFPRDKVCGGGLRPEIMEAPEFSYLTAKKKEFLEGICTSVKIYGTKPSHFIAYESEPSEPVLFGTSRQKFDHVLFRLAQDSGAETLEKTAVRKVAVKKDHVSVLLEGGKEVTAKVLVGAGGMLDPVARYLRAREGLPTAWPTKDIGFAVAHEYEVGEGFIEGAFGKERTCHFHMKPKGIYGYAWVFPRRTKLNVGYGGFFDEMKGTDMKGAFKGYLSLLRSSGLFPKNIDKIEFKGARIPLRGPIERTVSDRIILVGDSAGFVSPLSGDGINFAMFSGLLASKSIVEGLEKDDCTKRTLMTYEKAWRALWGKDFKALCDLADIISKDLDRMIEVCGNDEEMVSTMVGIYNGRERPSKVISSMKMRYLWRMISPKGK